MEQPTSRTDRQIRDTIEKRLDWSGGLSRDRIGVGVSGSTVTLAGEVDSVDQKSAVLELALDVRGVSCVVDQLMIATPGLHDDVEVCREVNALFEARLDEHPEDHDVRASVRDGVVTVAGMCESIVERHALDDAVRAFPGVQDVVNEITVRPTPSAADVRSRIADAITAIARHDADDLTVEVDGHVTRLRGTVQSTHERRAAEHAAAEVTGVTEVDNQLVVTS